MDVEKVLDSSINVAMNHIRPRARLVRDYQPLLPVLADESRIGQVFLNLLVNAAQAVPEGGRTSTGSSCAHGKVPDARRSSRWRTAASASSRGR